MRAIATTARHRPPQPTSPDYSKSRRRLFKAMKRRLLSPRCLRGDSGLDIVPIDMYPLAWRKTFAALRRINISIHSGYLILSELLWV
jgi:hypothetical protein